MPAQTSIAVRLFWWTLFATAFGCTEACTVVYLRRLMGMPPNLDYPAIFAARQIPFHSASVLTEIRRHDLLTLELFRETATLLLILGAAWAAGRTNREKWGLFGWAFAVWDLTYYAWLAGFVGFPRRLNETDLYFLIPIAWYGPVWFPVLVVMPLLLLVSWRLLVPRKPQTC